MTTHHAPTTALKSPVHGGGAPAAAGRRPTAALPHTHPFATRFKSPQHWGRGTRRSGSGGPRPTPGRKEGS
jgi:hypothetical protein